jgi:hypothetical protein
MMADRDTRMEGTILFAGGSMRRWAIANDQYGVEQLWLWEPGWGAWMKGGPQVMCLGWDKYETPEELLQAVGQGVGYLPGKAPVVNYFDGPPFPPVLEIEGASLPFWLKEPENPAVPGVVSSVTDGVAHISRKAAKRLAGGHD